MLLHERSLTEVTRVASMGTNAPNPFETQTSDRSVLRLKDGPYIKSGSHVQKVSEQFMRKLSDVPYKQNRRANSNLVALKGSTYQTEKLR